jgi:Amt family ammonium transporter
MTMLATHLAAVTATCVWIAIEWIKYGKPSLVGAATGMVAGLATITPASGFVGPLGAVALGFTGGAVCYVAVAVVKRGFKVDDALDVLGVHGVGGALGSLLLPFATLLGVGGVSLSRPVLDQFFVQGQGVIIAGIWSLAVTFVIVKLVLLAVGLRAGREAETQGLDFASHGETGYNINT